MPRAIWTGSISFGLVNIPVKLFSAVHDKEVRFHMLHERDGSRVQQKLVCRQDGEEIPRDEIVKGYEFAPEQFVVVRPEELEAVSPEASRTIDILDFVDLPEIDPIYYDRPYYLVPDKNAEKAYGLLVHAMDGAKKVAIARFVMRDKEYLAALRPAGEAIMLETMRFSDEVVSWKEFEDDIKKADVSDRELKVAQQLVDSLTAEFEPDKYRDEYRGRVLELIDRKVKGEEIVIAPAPAEQPKVIDLVSALEASLAEARKSRKGSGGRKSA